MNNAIIMLTCNRKEYTQKTLENYERQLIESGNIASFNFFIYDNGSTDGTKEYLKSYQGNLLLEVTYGEHNIGIAEATKYLLKEKCFGRNFNFIIKVDDDELIPDGWTSILDYWGRAEEQGAVFIGFKRDTQYDYFQGFEWITSKDKDPKPFTLGSYECYLAALSPGIQISKEKWWKQVMNDLSDFGCLYGGWDHTLFCVLKNKLKKSFMVVWNRETNHFQRPEEHQEFSKLKTQEMQKFRKKMLLLEKFDSLKKHSKNLKIPFPDKEVIWDSVSKLF